MFLQRHSWLFLITFTGAVSGIRVETTAANNKSSHVVHLFSNATAAKIGIAELERTFDLAYNKFENLFDYKVVMVYRARVELSILYCCVSDVRPLREDIWRGDEALPTFRSLCRVHTLS